MNASNDKKNLYVNIILIFLVSLATFSTDLYIPAFPSMIKVFHATAQQLQWSLISYMYGFALCMLLSGICADFSGRKKTLLIGMSIYTIASFLILFITNINELIILRFFQGLGGCVGTVIARVIVRDKFKGVTAIRTLALLSSGMAVAFIVSPACGSFLVHFYSWKLCFIIMCILGIALLLGIWFLIDETQKQKKKLKMSRLLHEYKTAFFYKNFILHTITISLSWTGFFLIVMEYPVILMVDLKVSTLFFGLIFPTILLGYLCGTKAMKWLLTFGISPSNMAFIGVIIMTVSCLVELISNHTFENSLIFLIFSGFLYLFGMGIQMPNSQYLAIPEEHKSSAIITSLLYLIEMMVTALISHFIKSVFSIQINGLWLSILVLTQIALFSFYLLKFCRKSSTIIEQNNF